MASKTALIIRAVEIVDGKRLFGSDDIELEVGSHASPKAVMLAADSAVRQARAAYAKWKATRV